MTDDALTWGANAAGTAHGEPSWKSLAFEWLMPVRAASAFVHYVYRDKGEPLRGATLCGQEGSPDRYGNPKLRRVRGATVNSKVCNACHAAASRMAVRIDWTT